MGIRTLKIAIVSDLHCHPKRKKDNETYLFSDMLRYPVDNHPIESLIKVVSNNTTVNLILCPGDFTDKTNIQGFIAGWNYSLEISRFLKSSDIIATLGNHDVDPHNKNSSYSLETSKGIKQGFPFESETDCDSFWSKGCEFVEKEDYRVLVINSSHFHHNKANSKSGKIDDILLEYIKLYLQDKNDDKINIAMSHHHPIDHSRLKLGDEDKIINADELLNVLGEFSFDLFIHGHKHDPLLRYHHTTRNNYKLPIFSSGSFSATPQIMFASIRNYFHVIELTKSDRLKGKIESWTFFPEEGWKINFDENGFAPYTGFGNEKSVQEIFLEIQKIIGNQDRVTWERVITTIPDISYLIPSDSKKLQDLLSNAEYVLDENIWKKPKNLFNLKKNNEL